MSSRSRVDALPVPIKLIVYLCYVPIYIIIHTFSLVATGLLAAIQAFFFGSNSEPTKDKNATPSPYPPAHIDWSTFEPPSVADARSPCPMINALCNHHILPHNGRNITKPMAIAALVQSLNLGPGTAHAFASRAVKMNPDTTSQTFDLNHLAKHNDIEHDVSLSRNDAGFGDNHTFHPEIWADVIATYDSAKETSFQSVSRARYSRVKASRLAHADAGIPFRYGIKELVLSYGESALCLGLLGGPVDGKIPVEYLRILFEQNRVPHAEGWRKSPRPIGQKDMFHLIFNLIWANEERMDEAQTVGLGTVTAVQGLVKSHLPETCSVM